MLQDIKPLGTGKDAIADRLACAGGQGDRFTFGAHFQRTASGDALLVDDAVERTVLLRHQRPHPVFVRQAPPAALRGGESAFVGFAVDILQRHQWLVFLHAQVAIDHAHQAHVRQAARGCRTRVSHFEEAFIVAVPLDRANRPHGPLGIAGIGQRIFEREHVIGIDRDLAINRQARRFEAQRDRRRRRQLAQAHLHPRGIATGNQRGPVSPIKRGEIAVFSRFRAEQANFLCLLDCQVVLAQAEIVDASPREADRTVNGIAFKFDPARTGNRFLD